MPEWSKDNELFEVIEQNLFTSVIGDVMDVVGMTHQFLPAAIQPISEKMRAVGRAMTVQEADCCGSSVAHQNNRQPFGLMFDALDALREGDVYICTGASHNYSLWGELMATRAMKLNARAAIVDGFSRDTSRLLRMGFPTFSAGRYGQDQGVRGRVIDYNCEIEFANGVRVLPGDLVVGDIDGVVVVPQKHETEIISAALEKVRGENKVRVAIESGMSSKQAFSTYGVM